MDPAQQDCGLKGIDLRKMNDVIHKILHYVHEKGPSSCFSRFQLLINILEVSGMFSTQRLLRTEN